MALFRRKKQQSVLPDEVNQYYASQRRQKTGVVFMLGILALIATLLVGLAVFFGGRFIYDKVRGDDKKPTTTQTEQGNFDNSEQLEIKEAENNDQSKSETGDQDVTPDTNGEQPDENDSGTPDSTTQQDQTPSVGDDEPTVLPRTGDEGQ